MSTSDGRTAVLRLLVTLSLASAAFADVRYVAASGNGQFSTIQAAIDAAADGDVLLVRSGTYAGFTLDDRSLWIVSDVGAVVTINTTVTVKNTSAGKTVVLSRLDIKAPVGGPPAGPNGLDVINNVGHVRVQSCTVRGGNGAFIDNVNGGHAASVINSAKVVFAASTLNGGAGGGTPAFGVHGGLGGHGALTQGSSVAFYDCALTGGVGGYADYFPYHVNGDGGDGCREMDYGILASGCQFKGGMGGSYASVGGQGGHGLHNIAGQAQLVDNTYTGGLGGQSYFGAINSRGLPTYGNGIFHYFSTPALKASGPTLAPENDTIQVALTGMAGDRIWLLPSPLAAFIYSAPYAGVWLIALPIAVAYWPTAVLPTSGAATVNLRTPSLPAGTPSLQLYWQCIAIDPTGSMRLGSPLHVTVLNCSDLLPDCNSNGWCDTCELLQGTSADCDHNGVPDPCDPDCNHNGISDGCDILNGTSLDQNHNGIPDECDVQGTLYVDLNAPPGGNGSASAPVQSLGAAFSLALPGTRVLVANGVYQGSQNRELDFAGRELFVESSGGAANCVIDCQLQGRAFIVGPGVPATARIQGLTILNGKKNEEGGGIYIKQCGLLIRDCRFESCEVTGGAVGGGIWIWSASPRIERCSFVRNKGRALYAYAQSQKLVDCTFVENTHGAIFVPGGVKAERCWFLTNSGPAIVTNNKAEVDQCVFLGNGDSQGGAIWAGNCDITGSTIIGNSALVSGGALYLEGTTQTRTCRNSIFWGNTSPTGSQIMIDGGALNVAWCDVQGGQAGVSLGAQANLVWGPGNQAVDPLFADPDGPDNDPITFADNDYRLSLSSSCIDAGDNAAVALDWFDLDGDGNVTEPVPYDFDGLARFVDIPSAPNTGSGTPPLVDLGAWERP